MARGRRWLAEVVAGAVTSVEQIAARDGLSPMLYKAARQYSQIRAERMPG
jgi:hypothetical protein